MNKQKTVSFFSAGVSSAVATKLIIDEVDEIIYTHIDDQHEDTMRFVKDCEQWFNKEIKIVQSVYKNVEAVVMAKRYINGVAGAQCTGVLKRRVRKEWEKTQSEFDLTYVWGMDCSESHRLERLKISMPEQKHRCPLIEKSISKGHAHEILKASGIKRPFLYDQGYHNNNCLMCVKGGMGYFNKMRIDYPKQFKQRAEMERKLGASCLNGIFLDELDPERGRHAPPIVEDCGIMCEIMAI